MLWLGYAKLTNRHRHIGERLGQGIMFSHKLIVEFYLKALKE